MKKSIKVNFLYNVVYQILLIILPLITTPYISRVLGAKGVGIFSYTYTVANYFVLFAMLGVKNYGNRSIAAVRDDQEYLTRTFWEIYGLQFMFAICSSAVYFGYVILFEQEYIWISLFQGIFVLSAILDISWFFFGLEEFKITVTRNIIIRLVNLALIFLCVKTREQLWIYTLIMAGGIFLSQSYLWYYVKDFVQWHRPSIKACMNHLKEELILFIPVIAVSLYKMMDKVMIGKMSNMTQVGLYESVEKIENIPLGIIVALGTVMLPRMSNMVAKGQVKESRVYIYNSMIFAMFMASAMMFGIAAIAPDFVPIFLGDEFYECILLLRVLSPTILFIAWANVIRTQYLIPNHMDKSYIMSVIAGAVVNLIINMLLIPRFHALGAVIGTISAEGCVCILQTLMVKKYLSVEKYLLHSVPFIFFGSLMLLFIGAIHSYIPGKITGVAIEIGLGAVVYLLMSMFYACKIFNKDIKKILK